MSQSKQRAGEEISGEDESFVGKSVDRVEDRRILTGEAEYIHDDRPTDSLEMALVRSSEPHARIKSVDTSAAEEHPDCELVLTVEDFKEHCNPLPTPFEEYEEWPLADGKVRYVGEPIAVVVATDRYVAEDVIEEIEVDYEPLDPVVDPMEAREDETVVHEDVGTNVAKNERMEFGDVSAAFEDADHVIEGEYSWERMSGVSLGTAGVVAEFDADDGSYEIKSNLQSRTWFGPFLAESLDVPYDKLHLDYPGDAAGSYGSRCCILGYCCMAAVASRELGRQVRFVEDRVEYLRGGISTQNVDREYEVELAIDDDGTIRGLDVWFTDDFGAYPRFVVGQVIRPLGVATQAYDVDNLGYEYELVASNKAPQTAYRGFGNPAHIFAIEMVIEKAARELSLDPVEVRERNLITPDQMPYKLPPKTVYDSGDYPEAYTKIRELVEENERCPGGLLNPDVVEQKREEGKYRGCRETLIVEPAAPTTSMTDMSLERYPPEEEQPDDGSENLVGFDREHLCAQVDADGTVRAFLGTDAAGQGLETIVSQLLADELGLTPDDVEVGYLDNRDAINETGQAGSRLAVMLSGAAAGLASELESNLERLAARAWGYERRDVAYDGGRVTNLETNETLSLAELAEADEDDEFTDISYIYDHPTTEHEIFQEGLKNRAHVHTTAAFNANAPIVEVDVETGEVEILKLYTIRDCGTKLNPQIVEGQYIGGIAQGIGAALFEEFTYDPESGRPQTETLFDYPLPTVHNMPDLQIEHSVTPSPFTATGAKGVGETGMTDVPASTAASINAALEPLGVVVDELPFTPEKAHERIQESDEWERRSDGET